MKWESVNHEHHRLKVKTWVEYRGGHLLNDIHQGIIECPTKDAYPFLKVGSNEIRAIPEWWDVEFVR